jgi:hypothetical protein
VGGDKGSIHKKEKTQKKSEMREKISGIPEGNGVD